MKLIDEFRFALEDGLGKAEARTHEVFLWGTERPAALAHASGNKTLYLLIDGTGEPAQLTPEEYLEIARKISAEFKAFVVPDQSLSKGHILWGGKTRGPICVFKFKVVDAPRQGFKLREVAVVGRS